MSDDAALIARGKKHRRCSDDPCEFLKGGGCTVCGQDWPCDASALCALVERVPQLELMAKRQQEMDEERAKAVRQVGAMEGALPFCRRQVEALKGRVEQAEARVAEQTARTHEYIDLHAAAARNNAALKDRVAVLEGLLKELAMNLEVTPPSHAEWKLGIVKALVDAVLAPRRDADGAEGTDV